MARAPTAIVRTPAPAEPGLLSRTGNFVYPNSSAALDTVIDNVKQDVARSEYARAAGAASIGAIGRLTVGALQDTGRPFAAAGRGIGNFLGGALGSGSSSDAIVTPPVPVAVATNPVAAAMTQGAAAAPAVSTADDIHSFIAQRLRAGVTNHDLAALSGIAAAVPALTKVQQTNKDKIAGTAGAVTDAEFAADLAAAKKLGAGSPEYDTAVQKATDKYRQNLATLIGVNPQGLSMQAMLAEQQAGDQ